MRIKLTREKILRLLDGFPVQQPTEVGLLEFEAEQSEWCPLRRHSIPANIIKHHQLHEIRVPDELWSNDVYEVFVAYLSPGDPESGWHLSIKRMDRAPIRNWRHFQQMKNEICGEFCEGLELFPGEHRLADNANQYHLWVMPEGNDIPIGFSGGMTLLDPTEVQAFNRNGDAGRQEPRQPGMTMGDGMEQAQRDQGTADHPTRQAIIKGRGHG